MSKMRNHLLFMLPVMLLFQLILGTVTDIIAQDIRGTQYIWEVSETNAFADKQNTTKNNHSSHSTEISESSSVHEIDEFPDFSVSTSGIISTVVKFANTLTVCKEHRGNVSTPPPDFIV
jgi:hypothetical protein